jgi:uncharacterized protein (TIGR02646 family)
MIKLERPGEPAILIDNSKQWLANLQAAIKVHGSYKKIPDAEKAQLVSPYRHQDIKDALSKSSNGKCAFCECHPAEGGYIQVEHYKPKSIYPDSTFEWINLLPCCAQCNGAKFDHDTEIEPLINPYDEDPATAFYFDYVSIKPLVGPMHDRAKRTIEVCSLEGIRLWKPRAEILVSLTTYAQSLQLALDDFADADTQRKKDNRIRRIRDSILTIESLAAAESKYSAFCTHFLKNCRSYLLAKVWLAAY